MTTEQDKILGTDEAWDDRTLGADDGFVAVAQDADEEAIDDALELKPISIRLHKSLIEDFKLIAQLHGIGYQPLMRQVLTRFAECEKKQILREFVAASEREQKKEASREQENDEPRTGTNG
jgi:hypothetical protein